MAQYQVVEARTAEQASLPHLFQRWWDQSESRVAPVSQEESDTSPQRSKVRGNPEQVGRTGRQPLRLETVKSAKKARPAPLIRKDPGLPCGEHSRTADSSPGPGPSSQRLAQKDSLCRDIIELQIGRRLTSRTHAQLHHLKWGAYEQTGCHEQGADDGADGSIGRGPGMSISIRRHVSALLGEDYVSSMALDSDGKLLISGTVSGGLALHSMQDLRNAGASQATRAAEHSGQQDQGALKVLQSMMWMDTQRRLEAVKWNSADENWAGTVSVCDREVHLYDLVYCQGLPTRRLAFMETGPSGTTAVGLNDLAFFHGGPYSLVAAGQSGQVYAWDTRAGSRPRTTLQPWQKSGPINSLQVTPDNQAVVAASQSGEVLVWDMRGGGGSVAKFGAQGPQKHSLLHVVNVRTALLAVPGLAEQTNVPQSGVHALLLDPADSRFAAFHLACGWSGRLDITSGAVSHVHCPPAMWSSAHRAAEGEDEMDQLQQLVTNLPGWRVRRRQPAWAASNAFCLGSPQGDSVHVLDFSANHASPCAVNSSALETESSVVRIPLVSPPVVSLAAHPHTHELVAGTQNGYIVLISPSSHALVS